MILDSLTLENFRQYQGRQDIFFATGEKENVTLIHGENGFGKTCLLNSLLWGFYGQEGLSADLPSPHHILPDPIREGSGNPNDELAKVTIKFRDGGDEFALERSITLADENASSGRDTKLLLRVTNDEGITRNYQDREAQRKIDSLMPPGMREYLFFNGERIDYLAMQKNSAQIKNAIHRMLGLEILQATVEDLNKPNVRGVLNRELRDNTDEQTATLIDREKAIGEKITSKQEELETERGNLIALEDEIQAIDAKLVANQQARELQKERQRLEEAKEVNQKKAQELGRELSRLISTEGYSLFAEDLVTRGKELTDQLRSDGKIPARVMNSFIHDLLNAGQCICGCDLQPGSEAYVRVQTQLTHAGDPQFNEAVSALDNAIGVIQSAIPRTREEIRKRVKDRDEILEDLRVIREDLAEIHSKLGSRQDQEVSQLESSRTEKKTRIDETNRRIGGLETTISELQEELRQVREDIRVRKQMQDKAETARSRLEALDKTSETLEAILAAETRELGEALNKEINRIFNRISVQNYALELTPEFALRLYRSVATDKGPQDVDVASSTGQRQLMSLVFISSLVHLAKERDKVPTIIKGALGGVYPLVMDSPFGQLGDEFRKGVANAVPELAPQVIIMASSSQYRGEVEEMLTKSKRVGKRYALIYHGPSKREDAEDTIQLNGNSICIYEQSDSEKTQVVEI